MKMYRLVVVLALSLCLAFIVPAAAQPTSAICNGLTVPAWVTANRPSSPNDQKIGYNLTTGYCETWQAATSQWAVLLAVSAGSSPSSIPVSGATLPGPFALGDTSGKFNIGSPQLLHWRKVLAGVRAGTARGTIAFIGDSTTAGAGAGSGGTLNYNGAFALNAVRDLAPLLAPTFPVSDKTFFNDQSVPIAYGTYDPRISLGTGWATTQLSLAGNMFHFTVGSAGTLAFTPAGNVDTIKIFYLNATGTFTVNVDGGASLGTVTPSGAFSVSSTSFSVTKASHTINIVAVNDAQVYILGIIATDSTVPAVDIVQLGESGATVANFVGTTNGWSPGNVLPILAPDLTVINLTINDSNAGTNLATYQANMQTLITTALTTGDVLLMAGVPSNTAAATNGTLAQYVAALRTLAVSNNIGLLDLTKRWTSYAYTNPVLPYFDSLHPGALGYRDIALGMSGALSAP